MPECMTPVVVVCLAEFFASPRTGVGHPGPISGSEEGSLGIGQDWMSLLNFRPLCRLNPCRVGPPVTSLRIGVAQPFFTSVEIEGVPPLGLDAFTPFCELP